MSFVLLLNISRRMSVDNLKLYHDHILCYSSHFIIHCHSMAYCLCQGYTYYPNSRSLMKIPGARKGTWIKFHAWVPNVLVIVVQNGVAHVNCSIEICSPLICVTDDIVRQTANKQILIITTYLVLLSTVAMVNGVARFLGAWCEKSQGLSLTLRTLKFVIIYLISCY
jgi:hypothetical protein